MKDEIWEYVEINQPVNSNIVIYEFELRYDLPREEVMKVILELIFEKRLKISDNILEIV